MLKILFVEDDKDLNMLTTSHLKKSGFTVTSTYNGLDALMELENQKFDMIISDIMMPLCDGFELAKRVRDKIKIQFLNLLKNKKRIKNNRAIN